jgi:23S rRNA (cytosine1962-C5)-methyltransferase
MDQSFDKYLMFSNRLQKVNRHIGKQARKQGITCYRLYDHDLPEFPFMIEVYEGRLYVSEYKRRHAMSDEAHDQWLEQCLQVMSTDLGIGKENIFLKLRQRKPGRLGQYQKIGDQKSEFIVEENGLKFIVNLSDYLDTGLFLDHRLTRQMVREKAKGKQVLNLFAYTGSFSVYALAGGASKVVTVDLSKTYLTWAKRNIELNFPDQDKHDLIHADAKQFLKEANPGSFDLVIMDPPTFSNSKRMEDILDVQRDHVELINDCLRLLTEGGELYFSTNYRKFVLEQDKLHATSVRDITKATTSFDFIGKPRPLTWIIVK